MNQHRYSVGKVKRGESIDKSNDTVNISEEEKLLYLQIQPSQPKWTQQETRVLGRPIRAESLENLKPTLVLERRYDTSYSIKQFQRGFLREYFAKSADLM